MLFNIYSEELINQALEGFKGVTINGVNYTNIRFADDTVVIAETEDDLQHMIDSLNTTCIEYGMALNAKKTKTMVMSKANEGKVCKIRVNNTELDQVEKYKYLGAMITEDGRSLQEVKRRIAIAKDAFMKYGELLKNKIAMKTKKKVLDCYIYSALMYGCESWTINEESKRRIEAFEMWCLRRILMISWMDRVTNQEVLRRAGKDTKTLYQNICRRKLKFAGHIIRGSSGMMCTNIIEGAIEGRRSRGRQRKGWFDNIKEWMNVDSYGKAKRRMEDKRGYKRWSSMFRC